MLGNSVVEVLEKSVAENCWREVLENSGVEKCWRGVAKRIVEEECCREGFVEECF